MEPRFGHVTLPLLAGLAMASAAWAGPGDGAPATERPEPTNRRLESDYSGDVTLGQRGQPPSVDIEGKVLDTAGHPIPGVLVKAFADGLISGVAKTGSNGSFRLSASLVETSGEGSAVLWFESPNDDHIDGQIVLWTGEAAKAQGLFPACTQLAPVQAGRLIGKVEFTMQTTDERRRDVAESRCLETAGGSRSPR